jgi:hypothetical protein
MQLELTVCTDYYGRNFSQFFFDLSLVMHG